MKRLTGRILAAFFLFLLPNLSPSLSQAAPDEQTEEIEGDSRRLLGLVEYIRGDYQASIREGQIINQDEFNELMDFSKTSSSIFSKWKHQLSLEESTRLEQELSELQNSLEAKRDHSVILELTSKIKQNIILAFKIKTAPIRRPDKMLGENVYKNNCATCHGGDGRADTPLSKTLMPAPTNFHDEDLMLLSSPFKFFNTLETGIKGTAMPSFKAILSEEECWSVSFYLSSLRFSAELGESSNFDVSKFSEGKSAEPIYVAALARMSDSELESHLKKIGSLHESESKKWLAYMRREAPYQKLVPLDSSSAFVEEQAQPGQALLSSPSPQDATQQRLAFLRKKLTDAEKAFSEHRRQAAEGFLLDAYLDGFDGLEMDLLLIDSAFVKGVELEFIKARSLASSADLQSFQSSLAVLRQALDRAEGLLSKTRVDTKDSPFWESAKLSSFFSSFMIIVREGFEAFLVIAALLAMASQLGVARARYFVHLGWLSAVLAGFVTYFLFEKILSLSGSARELVEAVSTGIAALVLFYTGFWLLSQSERQRWMAELKTRASSALHQNQLWVIFSLSFIAAYREAAETVLFYSALFNNTASPGSVVLGLVMGSVLLFSVGWCILRYQIKLPLRKFFLLTSSLMILLSVILTGKAVKELIEAGLVHSTQLSFVPAIELLGIYPSLETLMSQCGLLFLGVLLYGAWKRKKRSSETF